MRRGLAGMAWRGTSWIGAVRNGRLGMLGKGQFGRDEERLGGQGNVRCVSLRSVMLRPGKAVMAG